MILHGSFKTLFLDSLTLTLDYPFSSKREREREREMATTSGAVVNGLGSSFLCGGNRGQTLLSTGGVGSARVGATTGPKRFIVVAAVQPKKSWVPGVRGGGNFIDPEWLDGS